MSYCLKKNFIANFILFSNFKPMYLLESKIPNKCPNIFMRRKKSWTNVWIYSLWRNPQIFERMNIFVNKYLNLFEYPNIRYTLIRGICSKQIPQPNLFPPPYNVLLLFPYGRWGGKRKGGPPRSQGSRGLPGASQRATLWML